jgi:predicted nucleic-acid-binding Zn-ribbon protein
MKSGHPCPKCGGTAIERFESVRSGGGPLSVGHIAADAFTMFSQFDAFVCDTRGCTEFYRK